MLLKSLRTREAVLSRFRLAVMGLLLTLGFAETSPALTIAIGGKGSAVAELEPGVHVTARLVRQGRLHTFFLPCLVPVPLPECLNSDFVRDRGLYRDVENNVFRLAKRAAARRERVIILGYSHGATAALRVVRKLSKKGKPLEHEMER